MQTRRVSILTPMYNTEKYVHRLLDSVLSQDYPWIEMVVVDDGSTDGSKEVVAGYAARFAEKGYSLRYVYQANAGQSAAVKNGLPLVTGEYLTWPDSDDFYASDQAISKMVGALESAGEAFQMVRTQVRYVEDGSLRTLRTEGLDAKEEEDRSLFEDCLLGTNGFFYCAGSYLVRTEILKELTGFDIYTEKNAGQNWQLMLPVLYAYRCKTILEPLYTVVVRGESHSRGQYFGYDRTLVKYDAYVHTLIETVKRIKGISEGERSALLDRIRAQKGRWQFELAVQEHRRRAALQSLPACRPTMSRREYRAKQAVLHLPGGTCLLQAYKEIHHQMHLIKKRLSRHDR